MLWLSYMLSFCVQVSELAYDCQVCQFARCKDTWPWINAMVDLMLTLLFSMAILH